MLHAIFASLVAHGRRLLLTIVGALAALAATPAVNAQVSSQDTTSQPALITADEVTYDRELQIVMARGNVEVTQGPRTLRASVLSYNQQTNVITASGNVVLLEPTGEIIFADYIELTDDMREGAIQNLRMLLADRSRLAAVSGRRAYGSTTVARRGVYSPCDLCREDPTRAPTWQIKAARVQHNQEEKQVEYRDAWLEMFGVPLAYTPYMAHPDGTVERKSGLLAPTYSTSDKFGTHVSIPYFQIIDESSDITFQPIFVLDDTPVGAAEYRSRMRKGEMVLSGSVTRPQKYAIDGQEYRGHAKGIGRFDIDDDWRWGFDVERASDKTYLRNYKLLSRYRFVNYNTLTSRLFTEGFRGNNYAAVNSYAFQGLREVDDSSLQPIVLPSADYNYISDRDEFGGYYTVDGSLLSIQRRSGTDMQRGTLKTGWHLPHIASTGEIYSLSATVQGDVYHVGTIGSERDPFRPTEDGVNARLFPQLNLGWRYPLIRRASQWRFIVEPITTVSIAPTVHDQRRLPNEDSRGVDFDETNLFSPNRFTGYDRVEGGRRVNYGFNTETTRYAGGQLRTFIGQSYRLQTESAMPTGSGLDDKQSSYITKVSFAPHQWVSTAFRSQFSAETLTSERTSVGVSLGPPRALQYSLSYVFVEQATQVGLTEDIEQIVNQVTTRVTPNWRVQAYDVHAIGENSGQLLAGATAIYEDECLLFGIDLTRRFIGSANNPHETALVLRLVFRNLGEVTASPSVDNSTRR